MDERLVQAAELAENGQLDEAHDIVMAIVEADKTNFDAWSALVELAQSFESTVTISNDEKSATADSVMGLLMLESAQGQQICVSADGNDAEAALSAVSELIEAGFDEES